MRDIIFRGKRTDNGEWVEGADIMHKTIRGKLCIADVGRDWVSVDPETVGQYTGLTDKNGKKIFEGDKVYCFYSNISPFTDESEPGNIEVIIDDIRKSELIGWIDYADEIEIIGNIYDNPELLEGGVDNG